MTQLQLLKIDEIHPDEKNPRAPDEFRLGLVELSLRKLGWLLPIVVDKNRMILSGHQRTRCAKKLGFEQIPVVQIDPRDQLQIRRFNLIFNRATNDMGRAKNTVELRTELASRTAEIIARANALPDLDVKSHSAFACFHTVRSVPTKDLCWVNAANFDYVLRDWARKLDLTGASFPIVVTESLKVVNGLGRLQLAAENDTKQISCVVLGDEQAALAADLLNLVTMDFSVEDQYRDALRYNSFRRSLGTKPCLGIAFTCKLTREKIKALSTSLDETTLPDGALASAWRKYHGTRVIDFGAGKRQDVAILKAINVESIPFEPYPLVPGSDTISREIATEIAKNFLAEVCKGGWTSVFSNSILNSVPYVQDREHIVRIWNALCQNGATLYATAVGTHSGRFKNVNQQTGTFVNGSLFRIDYEPNVTLELSNMPKMQKYHTPAEFYDLFAEQFEWVDLWKQNDVLCVEARNPKPVDPARLAESLHFEFNLPYPDGEHLGLGDLAVECFTKNLGMQLA